ncbi:MAG TPA: glycolate oxidase subunit GlcE [Steroidobacteraceae bacterium]|nr:glycolate oxidase subunit GlcE [Steroidobacteraceae bacterium]
MAVQAIDARDAPLVRLVDAVQAARAAHTALEIRGGGTKAFYGEAPRGRPLPVAALAGISSYEPSELVVTARAGTPLAQLEEALAERGQCLPFEAPRFAPGGTVGGMVAAGLSGPARAAAGAVRDHLLGATLLTGRGEIQSFGGQVIKNVAGYDVARLLCGSWGILGLILEVSLKVTAVRPATATLCFDCDEAEAMRRLALLAPRPLPLTASAWHRGRLSLRFAGACAAVDAACAELKGERLAAGAAAAWWQEVRDHRHAFFQLNEAALARGESLWRLSRPATAVIADFGGERFIEWGGALLWWRGVATAAALRAAAAQAGGHATLVRTADKSAGAFAPLGEPLLRIHRRLKEAFDPLAIFNPGRLYPEL